MNVAERTDSYVLTTFTYQKTLLHTFLLLVFKIVCIHKIFSVSIKIKIGFNSISLMNSEEQTSITILKPVLLNQKH